MPLTFPIDCDTPAKRTEYCYRAQELLRWLHNAMWYWHNIEVAEAQWAKLPNRLRNRYPYKAQLPENEWVDYKKNVEQIIEDKITDAMLENRAWLQLSNAWSIDIGEL